MACGKKSGNAPTEEFILESPAPVDVAAKISAIYRELSEKVSRASFCLWLQKWLKKPSGCRKKTER